MLERTLNRTILRWAVFGLVLGLINGLFAGGPAIGVQWAFLGTLLGGFAGALIWSLSAMVGNLLGRPRRDNTVQAIAAAVTLGFLLILFISLR